MVVVKFSSFCLASVDPPDCIAQSHTPVPLFLHVFQKLEQYKLSTHVRTSSGGVSAHENRAAVDPQQDAYVYRNPIEGMQKTSSLPAARTSKSITNEQTAPSSDGTPKYRSNGFYLCSQASFEPLFTQDALAHSNFEPAMAEDLVNATCSNKGHENCVSVQKQASDAICLGILSREEVVADGCGACIGGEVKFLPTETSFGVFSSLEDNRFDASSAKVVADGNFFFQGEGANDVTCEASSAVTQIVDDVFDVGNMSFCNAPSLIAKDDNYFPQYLQRNVTTTVLIKTHGFSGALSAEESVFDDHTSSTICGAEEIRHDTSFDGPILKKDNGCTEAVVPIAKSVPKVTMNVAGITQDVGFTEKACIRDSCYSAGEIIHEAGFPTTGDADQKIFGSHITSSLSGFGMPSTAGHPETLEKHLTRGVEMPPNEDKLFISDIDKTDGKDLRTRPSRTAQAWQDLWHFQEEKNDGLVAQAVSDSRYADVINAVLDIARSLPKNETLQDYLHPFAGRIDALCGNAILYKLQNERLFVSAFSCFEWLRAHNPCLLASRSLCTIFTISGESNMVNRALVLFDNLKHSKELWAVQAFNALLSALSKHCRYDEALAVFQEMSSMRIQPDSITFCILMNLASKSGSGLKVLWQIFSDMEEQKVFAGHEVFAVLMKAFCKEGLRDEALKLLSVMEGRGLIPNIVIYNTLIDAFGKSGFLEDAEGLLSEMKAKGIRMSVVTYNILIDAYGNARKFEIAESLLQEMLDKGPEPNVSSFTALIAAYGRNFLSEKAGSVFLRMKKNGIAPNAIAYTALIHAYAEDGWHDKAELAFQNMCREGFIPSVETYTSLLHAFRQAGDLEKVKIFWRMMQSERCRGTRATFNVLMDACAKQGDYAEARDVIYEFNKIGIKPDRKTYNMLLNAYARGGEHCRVPDILEEMKNAGFSPDSFTYTTLIFSFLRVRDFTRAFKYHEKMCKDDQLPDIFTYRKLRAVLDAKEEIKSTRNMKAVIGVQRTLLSRAVDREKVKCFHHRRRLVSSPRQRKSSRYHS